MNAYELADEIDSIAFDWLGKTTSGKLANMLRQQADRIAKLESYLEAYKTRIAELEKDLLKYDRLAWDDLNKQGSEPYCWRMKANDPNDKDWWLFGRNPNRDEKVSHSAIPLYTTPQIKELSDEEIKPLLDRIQNYLECGGLFNPECMEHDKVRDLIMACKAILKKASEK